MPKLHMSAWGRALNASHPAIQDAPLFLTGIALAFVFCLVSTLLAYAQPLTQYSELLMVCQFSGVDPLACQTRAAMVGSWLVLALGLVLITAFAVCYRSRIAEHKTACHSISDAAFVVLCLATLAILGAHYIFRVLGDIYVSRIATIRHEALFIALENLLWPLLLQLLVIEQNKKRYVILLALLINVATLTPYRAVLFAIIVFGLFVPLLLRWFAAKHNRSAWQFHAVTAVLTSVMLLVGIYGNSQARLVQGEVKAEYAANVQRAQPEVQKAEKVAATATYPIIQRLVYPLYQANFAERSRYMLDIPNPLVEFTNRFKITNIPSFNQLLYTRIYTSEGGQTTSLLYGEGAVYTTYPASFWALTVGGILLLIYLGASRLQLACGVLLGLAFWRGSMSGLFNILPSLCVQLIVLYSLVYFSKRRTL